MNNAKRLWIVFVGLVLLGLPVAGHQLRRGVVPGCDLDGTKIELLYRVEIVDSKGEAHVFCCPRCARIWLAHERQPPRAVTVTDEISGELIDASSAWYVRSSVLTNQANGNRVHIFRGQADAEKHAATFAGIVLSKSERPFPTMAR